MTNEFKSFYKTVGGNEGSLCKYPTRLDAYGRGCSHDCQYCYAKLLLDFRNLWDVHSPAVADINKVRKVIGKIEPGATVRLGGMTDCFQPIEKEHRVTYEIIKALNERGVHYLIVTKSAIVAEPEYLEIMDKNLAHIQVSITSTDDVTAKKYENASLISERIQAVETLQELGFDVQVRLSPFIPEYIDFDKLNAIKCDKILIEFLRTTPKIQTWTDVDYSKFTLKHGGYRHLTLEEKIERLKPINGFKEYTICEDVPEHYHYWEEHFNMNREDCCNLRK